MVEAGMECGGHFTQSPCSSRATEGHYLKPRPDGFGTPQGMEALQPLCPVLGKTHRKGVSWCPAWPSCAQFVSTACPVTGHHWIFSNPPFRGLLRVHQWWFIIDDTAQSFLIWEVLQPLINLCGASLVSLQYVQYLQVRMGSKQGRTCVKHTWKGSEQKTKKLCKYKISKVICYTLDFAHKASTHRTTTCVGHVLFCFW